MLTPPRRRRAGAGCTSASTRRLALQGPESPDSLQDSGDGP